MWSRELCLIAVKLIFLCYWLSHLSFRIQLRSLLFALLGYHQILLWLFLVLRLVGHGLAGKTVPDYAVGLSRPALQVLALTEASFSRIYLLTDWAIAS